MEQQLLEIFEVPLSSAIHPEPARNELRDVAGKATDPVTSCSL
jgi:hypothetical protein